MSQRSRSSKSYADDDGSDFGDDDDLIPVKNPRVLTEGISLLNL